MIVVMVVLIVTGLALMALPAVLDRRCTFEPARLARVARASLVLGFASVVLGVALWGAPALLHWFDAVGVPGLCDAAVHRLPLGGLELAIAMMAIAMGLGGLAVSVIRRARLSAERGRVDPYFGRHRRHGRYDVVVIPSRQLVAVGVPGDRPQIVLSEALVDELSGIEVDAVIRHEVAHHRLRHRDYLLAAAIVDHAFGWLPPIRSSIGTVRDAVEEWADLESTRRSPRHRSALRSALVSLAAQTRTTAAHNAIARRLASLDRNDGPARQRTGSLWSCAPAVALTLLGALTLVFAVQITDAVIRCHL